MEDDLYDLKEDDLQQNFLSLDLGDLALPFFFNES